MKDCGGIYWYYRHIILAAYPFPSMVVCSLVSQTGTHRRAVNQNGRCQQYHVDSNCSGFDDYTLGEPLLTTLSEDVVSNYEVMKDEDKNCCKSPVLNTVVGMLCPFFIFVQLLFLYSTHSVPSLLLISIDSSEIAMLTELEQPFT